MSAAPSGKQNSRFSTLKLFKLAASGSKPPPPPPKDPLYLANPSLTSLTLNSFSSQPVTPTSTYAASARSPSPSPSYATSRYTQSTRDRAMSASTSTFSPPDSAGPRKGLFKLPSFTRRPKTPKDTKSDGSDDSQPPEPQDDPSISMPWNFQHNIHVDEGFGGLPPTWSAQLSEAGFSQEEIVMITARREAARSPPLHPIQGMRSRSPGPHSLLGASQPTPRSSSLRRDTSDTSLSQSSDLASIYSRNMSRQYSESSATHSSEHLQLDNYTTARLPLPTPMRSITTPMPSTTPMVLIPPAPTSVPPSAPSELSSSSSGSKDRPPRTPPRRAYHVANSSISTISSPPPAYNSSPKSQPPFDIADESFALPPPITASSASGSNNVQPTSSSSRIQPESQAGSSNASPLLSAPPRLSIHQDSLLDLASWSESLFSILPGEDNSEPMSTSSSTASGSIVPASSTIRSTNNSKASTSTTSSPHSRSVPHQKPVPLSSLPTRKPIASSSPQRTPSSQTYSIDAPERTTPLWDEVMSLVRASDSEDTPSTSPSPETPFSTYPSKRSESNVQVDTATDDGDEFEMASSARDNRDSSMSSMTVTTNKENRDSSLSTMTVTPATIVRDVVVVTRAKANVLQSPPSARRVDAPYTNPTIAELTQGSRSHSPQSVESHSSSSSGGASLVTVSSSAPSSQGPSSKPSQPNGLSIQNLYIESSPTPSPHATQFDHPAIITAATAVRKVRDADEYQTDRPSIVVDDISSTTDDSEMPTPLSSARCRSHSSSPVPSPISPAPSRYPGWVSAVVKPLQGFIDEKTDPRELFADLQEIAEGENGGVFAARVVQKGAQPYVAIKQVALLPSGSSKLAELEQELKLLKGLSHPHILTMNALYVDIADDALWVCMELMERSLADIIGLIGGDLVLHEKHMAQVASDVILALDYLRTRGIAHRDVRSDNLLINSGGLVKLADFSNAVQVDKANPHCSEPAGVVYWQAPEMRSGSYNALKVDVWSLGATVWEMAKGDPPFSDVTDASHLSDRWQSLPQPELYSRSFHDFLRLCSEPSSSRPDPHELLNTPFIRSAGGHTSISELLLECKVIEESLHQPASPQSPE